MTLNTILHCFITTNMAPNAHQNILTDSIKPEELEVANLFDVSGRVAVGEHGLHFGADLQSLEAEPDSAS